MRHCQEDSSPGVAKVRLLAEAKGSIRKPRLLVKNGKQGWLQGYVTNAFARDPILQRPMLGLMLCCHRLEIHNNFLTKDPAFALCTWPPRLCRWSWLGDTNWKEMARREKMRRGTRRVIPPSWLCLMP